ncbi:acyl-CoA dehydrogenase family protein [Ectopseudomonas hydrolytica]|uniref:Medium-chain specific acyl-CoA dehydrogenase, mitochondrial n=1 Tax=Ectopseudomonas hydrolytica TaxID=2493633 RepID=A0ABY5A503_9GAMM|nr:MULTISPECIES: acyl-CoA dehydrogenase family protein [Pseudomonas]ATH81662.1 acyl-CoA dehydrogenase [Pseudomonas mendocina]MDH0095449.1 acyl-CoA dehydrogenase family protein [Pseudomonas sp. GD04158]USR38134.1 acyl-CoA dehydrogenase family protein [Pseudomonas hydrolytica]
MIKPSEKAARLIEGINAFVRDELDPLAKREGIVWGEPVARSLLRDIWSRSCELGFYNAMLPQALGGAGLGVADLCALKEAAVLTGSPLAPHILGELSGPPRVGHLFKVANQYQVETFLGPICRAEKAVCFALTEAEAGSDATAIGTEARLEGEHYVLNGAKRYISGAPYADLAVLLAVTGPGRGPQGISAFFIDLHAEGVSIDSDYSVMSGGGAHGNILLKDVRVPVANRIGEEGAGFKLAMGRITLNRLLHCPTMLGMAGLALNLSLDYARTRKQFGQPIAMFQSINHMLADMATELYAARSMMYATAAHNDAGGDIKVQAPMCKLYASETAFRIADRAVQIHGGAGLIKGHPVEWIFRASRMMRILTGTSEIQRNTIAKGILMPG